MKKALYWFSHDLRLQDNHSLASLIKQADEIAFVYVIDPRWFKSDNYSHKQLGYHRWSLILESLQQLDLQLQDHGHQLSIFFGHAESVITELIKEHNIDLLGHMQQVGIYEQNCLQRLCQSSPQLTLVSHWDSTLFSPNPLVLNAKNLTSFSKFRKGVEKQPLAVIDKIDIDLSSLPQSLQIMDQAEKKFGWKNANMLSSQIFSNPNYANTKFKGGELHAIKHTAAYFSSSLPSSYKTTRNALDGWDNSTKMSHFLAIGNISARQIWQQIKQYEIQQGANESTYWIGFELLWREYFQWLALQLGSQLYHFQGGAAVKPLTHFSVDNLNKWCEGNTQFSLVNACMKELKQTGYISNRGRQIVASCLVNELGVDWRFGAAYFQQHLVDHDVASNWGNWQYIAGVGADPRGGRHFNIEKQTQQYDPVGNYSNKWLV